ncbi:Trigger factor [subsurface metagenome]
MKIIRITLLCTIILATLSIIGCGGGGSGPAAQDGDKVAVHYTGTLYDGSVFDSSVGRAPLEFVLGAGEMIPGFDKAVRGMKVGQTKKVTLSPDEAYGPYDPNLIFMAGRDELGLEVQVGQQLRLQTESGKTVIATVTQITEENITVDANHALAGKELTFEIELISIESAD